jgi:hypothetical protein
MFSFLGFRRDAFEQRRKQQEVWKFVRRIVDQSAPNLPSLAGETRSDARSNRCLPALLVPCREDEAREPCWGEPNFVVTKDFSDEGVSLLSPRNMEGSRVMLAFWHDDPTFLLGDVRSKVPFGGGFWQLGVRLCEILPPGEVEELLPLAQRLRPEAGVV